MRGPRNTFVLLLACAALAAWAGHASAVEIVSAQVSDANGSAAIELRLAHVLSDRIRGTLERGMPTTVVVRAELWRDRAAWWDPMVAEQSMIVRVFRNAWADDYIMRRNLEAERTYTTLDEFDAEMARPTRILLTPFERLDPDQRYYVTVTVTVKPLTVEDLEAVEKWLSGEARRTGKPGPGSIARLPKYLVGVLANLSGLGDEVTTWRSGKFHPDDIGTP